ncbi:MAG: hypothetical protein Kow0075_02630 [Salibacteraceae bacterium]
MGQQIVFNKTEHDFGTISQSEIPFEHDFLFRNMGETPVQILSVRSIQPALSFIHTRSSVNQGEYGFVKVKLQTDSLEGLFHDEVYITFGIDNEVHSEVIYLRAQISENGTATDGRKFRDSEIATSVEVLPSDIETLEGLGKNESEIRQVAELEYLRKQVALKSELIAKLSSDLQNKQASEKENLLRLEQLENTLRHGSPGGTDSALRQIQELSMRLKQVQKSDSLLKMEIAQQDKLQQKLKLAADSARQHAEQLSRELQQRFVAEAAAIERAQRLERDLQRRLAYEKRQEQKIDSLKHVLNTAQSPDSVGVEIQRLSAELELRKREQLLQSEHARKQVERISALRKERDRLASIGDSLRQHLSTTADKNQSLTEALQASAGRIEQYEHKLDSLKERMEGAVASSPVLDSLRTELSKLEEKDRELKKIVAQKNFELAQAEAERNETHKNLKALEAATERQLQETHQLLYKINDLSSRESAARLEIQKLRQMLRESEQRESQSREQLDALNQKIAQREQSIAAFNAQLEEKESQIQTLLAERDELKQKMAQVNNLSGGGQRQTDSLEQAYARMSSQKLELEKEMARLKTQVAQNLARAESYAANAAQLEKRLKNAHMSNELAFAELKTEVEKMRLERDSIRLQLEQAMKEIERLNKVATDGRVTAAYFSDKIVYRVLLQTGMNRSKIERKTSHIGPLVTFEENGREVIALGECQSFHEAIALKEQLQQSGFEHVQVAAFKNGRRISLKEALETASVD